MKVTIQKAKNGEETAIFENHFLHSNYAPLKEAERFVENLQPPYLPSLIIITEPALSYAAVFLKKRFPEAKLGAIRYSNSFEKYNKDFDLVFNYFEHPDFEAYLENTLNEEDLLKCFFLPWGPSSQAFSETDKIVWKSIKAAMERAKTLLITRQYFEKKWFINSCNFARYCKKIISFDTPLNKELLIISSGPSLNAFIKTIKDNQKKFFIICLSSAISVCLKNGIIPDLCMTSDGGYWAGEHLKALYKNDIPLAMPAEGYCKKSLLSKLKLLPLDYGDGFSHELLAAANIKNIRTLRNGTVSGTALHFALSNFTKNIFLCGMDMAAQNGYQHSQPNQLEINSSLFDNRLKNKMTRLFKSGLTNGSLDIYRQWFINNPQQTGNRKVYRLIENKDAKNNLGWIKDIGLKDFQTEIASIPESEKIVFADKPYNFDFNPSVIELLNNDKWKKQLFPLDYVQLSHSSQKEPINNKIEKEWKDLKHKAESILNADI